MKEIPLTQGQVALVDDEDFEWLNSFKWCAARSGKGGLYAQRNAKFDAGWKRIKMHNVILGCRRVDHRNGNGLDNQRHNLRPATQAQNTKNQRKRKGCSSQFKGVTIIKGKGRWQAQITVDYRCLYLGCFKSEREAAEAYDKAAIEGHGEFANLNFPQTQQKLIQQNERQNSYG